MSRKKLPKRSKIILFQIKNALVPLVREMQRRNYQIDVLASQPFYQAQIDQPEKRTKSSINVDHNIGLNDSDLQTLDDMSFESPNVLHDRFLEYEIKKEVQKEMDRLWEVYNKKKTV